MANSTGYAVIWGAISLSFVQQVLLAIKDIKVKREIDKYTEYKVPPVYYNIQDEFIKVSQVYYLLNIC